MTQKKQILVVDDNNINRAVLCKILNADGYKTLEAGNGQEALNLLAGKGREAALMLLDISMPVMNGYELLDQMTQQGSITRIPVIITTGAEDESTEVRCLERGASDFLRKPYNAELVQHRVKSLLRLWETAALISRLEVDQLTGVYSKEFFYRHAEELLDRNSADVFSIIYVDIDDFKMINARYGSAAGDELLRYLAAYYQKLVGKDGICGRIGGDIFVLLMKESRKNKKKEPDYFDTLEFADAPVKGFQLKCGIYPVKNRSLSIADMCDRAKLAVATIKHQYGFHYAVYSDSMLTRALREHQLADGMEEALEKGQFSVYLQPKHCTENKAVAGAEALVRWNHPELGFISPGEFISMFERNGFITKVDEYMLREVCRFLGRWISQGITPVPISVNISRADFVLNDLPERITGCVDAYNIPHELIHLEITESAYTSDPRQIIADVSALQDMGFLIEMDDFGSGYSSLNMLSELPIDILKLDMRFVQSGNDRIKGSKRNILSFIISLSKWLQLPTIAEGVETQDEFDQLKAMGCNLIQGFFFSKPMPAEEFVSYMEKQPLNCNAEKTNETIELLTPDSFETDGERPLILVTEDIESNREIMRALLSPSYRVALTENGKEACEYLMAHHNDIACMLLDLLMPVMDGFQVLEFMQSNGMINEIPVIITTETGSNSELRALHLGADSFVGKPYNSEILLHHVRKAVEEKSFWKLRREFENQKGALYEKAYLDELTNLLNRHGLSEAMNRLTYNEKYTAVILDIDDLKKFNDTEGHAAGDDVIRTVADVIKKETRERDIIARIGGDEFMVLFREMDNPKVALYKGTRLCMRIGEAAVPGKQFFLSCSAGITLACQSETFSEVFKRADTALYYAKREKKGGCCLWESQMSVRNTETNE